jgi:hypothetical protein
VGYEQHWCVVCAKSRHSLLSIHRLSAPLGSGVALVHDSAGDSPCRTASRIEFRADTGWITQRTYMSLQTVDLCWIPPDPRGLEYAVHRGSKVVIGAHSGAIAIIDLRPVLKSWGLPRDET